MQAEFRTSHAFSCTSMLNELKFFGVPRSKNFCKLSIRIPSSEKLSIFSQDDLIACVYLNVFGWSYLCIFYEDLGPVKSIALSGKEVSWP